MDSLEIEEFQIDAEVISSLLELDNDELEAFAELHEDMTDDNEVELFIFTCWHIFKKTGSPNWADKCLEKAQRWAASTPLDDEQYKRRCQMTKLIMTIARHLGRRFSKAKTLK